MSLYDDAWIVSHRPPRKKLDPLIPYEFFVEEERNRDGVIDRVATIFLTNRECPFRCLMCDLWRNTLPTTVPAGAIPAQIDYALSRLGAAKQIKLYNSGSFFDPRSIPPADHATIAAQVQQFERVIVENHPAFTGEGCARFRDLLGRSFEIAMGLETVHPEVLRGLNKRMTLEQFSSAARFLRCQGIDLRVFILVQPPLMPPAEALAWAERSLDFAVESGATAVTLIPTRGGNGAMEALSFVPPALEVLEAALEYGLRLRGARIFADLWGVRERCGSCHAARIERLRRMNMEQVLLDRVPCQLCGGMS